MIEHDFARALLDAADRHRHAEQEGGAVAGQAVDLDLAAHLLDQSLGDHQPQAGAAELACP